MMSEQEGFKRSYKKCFKIRPPFGFSKPVLLLVLLVGFERLLVYYLSPFAGGWGKVLHWMVVVSSITIAAWLLLRYFSQFLIQLRRILPGYRHLVRSRLGIRSSRAPEVYVRELFDDYAENFDEHLVGELEYQTPKEIYSILEPEMGADQRYNILDLGCGTGLCAPLFRSHIGTLVGIDLSKEMLAKAEGSGLYQALICDTLTQIDQYYSDYFDVVISADVLVYFGELDQVLMSAAHSLKQGGNFAFSVEVCDDDELWKVNPSGRYAHSRRYITELADRLGYSVVRVENRALRSQRGEPVMGDVYLLQTI